jgi:hypothetical protein
MTTKTLMEQLAAELAKPKKNQKLIEALNKQLDKALGTELKDEDTGKAEAWERGRRGSN